MSTVNNPPCELADVVRLYGDAFVRTHHPLFHQARVLNAISLCRTAALGGHLDVCDSCDHQRISYNSCRNRHCPKCQGTNRERWIRARKEDLLPVAYFHVVFTLPQQLNPFCLHHPAALYNILFAAARNTIIKLALDPKLLGAKAGMIALLHTWGQQLWLHPHLHCIVPGGGVTKSGQWRSSPSKGKFLFPVKVMSMVFRGMFMELFKDFCSKEKIQLPPDLLQQLYSKPWVVYAKQPFLGPQQVIEYLGRYSHRIAISNHRLKDISNGSVSFSYKDYKHAAKQKLMTLDAGEFLRRFCLHILPAGFMKIRHYGILASRAKPQLKMQQMKMGVSIVKKEKIPWQLLVMQAMNFDVFACPCCKSGRMVTVKSFNAHAPPSKKVQPVVQV